MAAPLVRELLRMQNAFNMEHFKDLQSAAVRALLVAYPGVAVPVVTGFIVSAASQADLTLGGKLAVLSDLILTAHTLAGIDMKDTYDTSRGTKPSRPDSSSSITESTNLTATSSDDPGNNKTRVKRPTKLAQHKALAANTNGGSMANRFGPVAQLFFGPVLRILASMLRQPATTPVLVPSFSSKSMERLSLSTVGDDNIESLLVAQCLLALGAYVRCSVNTRSQR